MMDMIDILTPASQVALIIGLVEVFKRLGCPSKWLPLIDVVLGVISGLAVYGTGDLVLSIMNGLAIGLSACGLFSGVKNTISKDEVIEEDDTDDDI